MISTAQTDSQDLSPLEPDPGTPSGPSRESRGKASRRDLIWPAIGRSFVKLDPRDVARNPVMFVVEVGSVITAIAFIAGLANGSSDVLFVGLVSGWLWFTVLFANFATAMAEGRGKAQADTLRKTKTETLANIEVDGVVRQVRANELRKGDVVVVSAGETIPGDGDVIEGIASVDESAITG
jgi:K+-transporting ATPase ATPase B chain